MTVKLWDSSGLKAGFFMSAVRDANSIWGEDERARFQSGGYFQNLISPDLFIPPDRFWYLEYKAWHVDPIVNDI